MWLLVRINVLGIGHDVFDTADYDLLSDSALALDYHVQDTELFWEHVSVVVFLIEVNDVDRVISIDDICHRPDCVSNAKACFLHIFFHLFVGGRTDLVALSLPGLAVVTLYFGRSGNHNDLCISIALMGRLSLTGPSEYLGDSRGETCLNRWLFVNLNTPVLASYATNGKPRKNTVVSKSTLVITR